MPVSDKPVSRELTNNLSLRRLYFPTRCHMSKRFSYLVSAIVCVALQSFSIHGQTLVYSGQNYLPQGKSYSEIRLLDLTTGKTVQLSQSARSHGTPWCASDGSILFTVPWQEGLYRLDRKTGTEQKLATTDQPNVSIVGELRNGRIVLQEFTSEFVIQFYDLKTGRVVRSFPGLLPSISSDQNWIAYQYPASPLKPGISHVFIAEVEGSKVVDLGPGETPVFFPAEKKLAYTHPEKSEGGNTIEVVIYDLQHDDRKTAVFQGRDELSANFHHLIAAPDGITMILTLDGGAHGPPDSYLLRDGTATSINLDLSELAGWSNNGLLLYSTSDTLRPLDRRRNVWASDIEVFDYRTQKIKPVVTGISANTDPQWCLLSSAQR
jgi:hypothetical protein